VPAGRRAALFACLDTVLVLSRSACLQPLSACSCSRPPLCPAEAWRRGPAAGGGKGRVIVLSSWSRASSPRQDGPSGHGHRRNAWADAQVSPCILSPRRRRARASRTVPSSSTTQTVGTGASSVRSGAGMVWAPRSLRSPSGGRQEHGSHSRLLGRPWGAPAPRRCIASRARRAARAPLDVLSPNAWALRSMTAVALSEIKDTIDFVQKSWTVFIFHSL